MRRCVTIATYLDDEDFFMNKIIDVSAISVLHRASIVAWKASEVVLSAMDFLALVEQNHAFNYKLWHAEDKARREDKGYAFVYHAKREIDGYNQQRNDCMEKMDEVIWTQLNPTTSERCPVHSETPGMMIDRLSILALKQYHMAEQVKRDDVDSTHRQSCFEKCERIQAQQAQLTQCLDDVLHEVEHHTRTFRLYRQFKMYNSTKLNPELYLSERV
jgi:hypothetical protein